MPRISGLEFGFKLYIFLRIQAMLDFLNSNGIYFKLIRQRYTV